MLFETIAKLIAERKDCDVSTITMESNFTDLGIDSLDTVDLVMNLEDELGIEIELTEKVSTVGELIAFIEKQTQG
jgi:acyl carrier protein